MKNIIKKCIVLGAFALVTFLGVGVANAASVDWTPFSGYSSFTRISNYTDCPGCSTWSTSISADPGDVITLDIYVRNIGSDPSYDTKVKITPTPSSPVSSFTFAGTITGTGSTGVVSETNYASVNITGGVPKTLTYEPSSLVWLPYPCLDGLVCGVPVSGGYAAAFGGGANIGLAPAMATYGHMQARFKVGAATVPVTYECNNGIDDDGDGLIDYPADPGCTSPTDDSEWNEVIITTPINVTTNSASSVSTSSATLNGYLNAIGTSASYATVYFQWGKNYDFDHTTPSNVLYSSNYFSSSISGLSSNTQYCYRAFAQNNLGAVSTGGTVCFYTNTVIDSSNISVTTNSPTSISTNSATLNGSLNAIGVGASYANVYFKWGKDYDFNYNTSSNTFYSPQSLSAGITGLTANTQYCYRAFAQNNFGVTSTGNTICFTTGGSTTTVTTVPDTTNYQLPYVVTTVATSVTGSTAALNGLLSSDGNTWTTGWFEWGTTNGLGFRTADQTLGIGDGKAFVNGIFGLSANTTYYFRACAKNTGGSMCGDVLNFRTVSTVNPNPPVYVRPTVSTIGGGGGNSRLMLEITSPYDNACPSDINDYTVHYKNISGRTLKDVILRVTLPQDIAFRKASNGIFSETDNTLTVELNDVAINQEGDIFISGEVTRGAIDEDILVATAVMAYTYSSTLGQEDAIAYKIHDMSRCGSSLAGFALFGNGFFPNTFGGWLLIILLIVILIAVARSMSRKTPVVPFVATHGTPYQSRSVNDLPQ